MKKKVVSFLLVLTLAVSLSVSAFAAAPDAQSASTPSVVDLADLLTDQEEQELEDAANQIAEQYQCGVYLLILPDFKAEADTNDPYTAARDIYLDRTDWGVGAERSGIVLMLSMQDRDFALMAHGYGNTAFTDYGKETLSKEFLDDFREDEWAKGFYDYVNTCALMLEKAYAGEPVDVGSSEALDMESQVKGSRVYGIIASVIIAILIALCVVLVLKHQLKSVAKKTEAAEYITHGGVQMHQQYDHYTHTTQTRIYEEPPKSNSGGTSVDRTGSSGMSGKF